ncbi:M14 family metallopeptidase [Ulvibacterium sp.]|uniref:M14 family metallopeptidase n=1 Tax=Ulvibacterium sp. TaxID=2665914 RepID=UPI002634017F|nr:M14 family metallopeptidase [Ulvibacterium sp.]
MRFLGVLLLILGLIACETKKEDEKPKFPTQFELSNGKETATYLQVVDFYIQLAKQFPEINIQTIGKTDSGYPLHMVTYNPEATFNFQKIADHKTILLINNGIHPGESDGIDATMLLYRDLVIGKINPPSNTVLVTIPVYNIGGALNRNRSTRANQNGPESYGFRGNTLNYDLNRDFIKADTKNSRTFTEIFHLVRPNVFIDTHVSNGADYQYTLSHLFTQHNKLGGELGAYLDQEMLPALEKSLKLENWDITPYVNVFNKPPEKGFSQFMDHPRYSTGYTALWNTLGLMIETHMLKPYAQRVAGTHEFLKAMLKITDKDSERIKRLGEKARTRHQNWNYYPIKWALDTTKTTIREFKGYKADTLLSEVTGFNRLSYDKEKPFTEKMEYRNHYKPIDSVKIPEAYILKKGWTSVIELLDLNKINYETLQRDSTLTVESYKIKEYKTLDFAYEGHYLHYDTKISKDMVNLLFSEGDLVIPIDQEGIRYLLETLEPCTVDSFFNWNFFDSILQRKEGFSPYIFENIAAEMLENDDQLRDDFNTKKKNDLEFADDWYAQLDWLYQKSKFYEPSHMQYPVYRIASGKDVP